MKNVIFMRHAKSSWDNESLEDFERPLNKRGKKDAPMMGKILAQKKICPDVLIVSPAKRTKKTAKIVAEEIHYDADKIVWDKNIYEGSESYLIKLIRSQPTTLQKIMIVGHNPEMEEVINYLASHEIERFPTAAVISLHFDTDEWTKVGKEGGKIEFFIYPKMFKDNSTDED